MADPSPGPGSAADASASPAGADASAEARSAATPAASEGLLESLQAIWRDLPGLVSDRVDLLSLELLRAGRSLAQIVALIVAAAILAVTAWLVLWVGVAGALVALGCHWGWALLLVLAVNALAAAWALARVRALLPDLRLPATRRHLMLSPSTQPAPAPTGQRPPSAEPPMPPGPSAASAGAPFSAAP